MPLHHDSGRGSPARLRLRLRLRLRKRKRRRYAVARPCSSFPQTAAKRSQSSLEVA